MDVSASSEKELNDIIVTHFRSIHECSVTVLVSVEKNQKLRDNNPKRPKLDPLMNFVAMAIEVHKSSQSNARSNSQLTVLFIKKNSYLVYGLEIGASFMEELNYFCICMARQVCTR